jgi:transcription antitermination factor NusG
MQRWLIIRTRVRWEKKVARLLIGKGIETYCPLIRKPRQWSDRIKTIELPLLKSHLFVRISEEQRTAVRLTEGVVNFVYENGKIVIIKEKLIQQIKEFHQNHEEVSVIKTEGQAKISPTMLVGPLSKFLQPN